MTRYADYDKAYTAADSVDGVADTWDQPLRGNFNQLQKLKAMHPGLKVIWSFGGWTWSAGFTQAAANPTAFANSCYNLVNDPRWAGRLRRHRHRLGVPERLRPAVRRQRPERVQQRHRARCATKFGSSKLVTAAITADGSNGGKIDAADYAGAAREARLAHADDVRLLRRVRPQGPTAPHSPLTSLPGHPAPRASTPRRRSTSSSRKGVPASKMLLGIGFYGRGWTGVTQAAPGGSATGAAPGTYEAGIEDYKVLKNTLPGHRHRRRHRVRQVRQQLVELRHPDHHHRQDDATPRARASAARSSGSSPATPPTAS